MKKLKVFGSTSTNYLLIVKETYKTITLAEYSLQHHSKEWVKVNQKRFSLKDFNDMIECGLLQYIKEE